MQAATVSPDALKAAFSEKLKDAESARFKDIKLKLADGVWLICGQVNAKNSFGAFAGFAPFFVIGVAADPKRPITTLLGATIGEVADERCSREGLI